MLPKPLLRFNVELNGLKQCGIAHLFQTSEKCHSQWRAGADNGGRGQIMEGVGRRTLLMNHVTLW
jgi:hypothetical protein